MRLPPEPLPRRALVVRPGVVSQQPYSAGAPARAQAGGLASNESPHGPAPGALAAVSAALGTIHRYPDPLSGELRQAIADLHDIAPDNVLVGAGSDEFFFSLVTAFAARGGTVATTDPRYWGHQIPAEMLGSRVRLVDQVDRHPDVAALAGIDVDLLFLCNPGNPLGTALTHAELAPLVTSHSAGLLVVDEAYVDYADSPAATTVVPDAVEGRCAVTRTFSKAYGLAGLRVGYIVAARDVVRWLSIARPPFPVNRCAQAAALAALRDQTHLRRVIDANRRIRSELTALLASEGLEVVPSQANFLCVLTANELGLIERFAAHGVSVRPGSALGFPGSIRVTVPDEEGLALVARVFA